MTMTIAILYVDDDADIRLIVKYALKGNPDIALTLADSGFSALDIMEQTPFDLILLDVMMPGLDGIQTFHAARKLPLQKKAKIVFVTAKVQREEIKAYFELGALDVIMKPFDPIDLPRLVEKYLKG